MKAKFFLLVMVAVVSPVWADPCGLVPPISTQDDPGRYLTRTGDQLTYVFYRNGIEDVCLRPAFKGKVSQFGMLIPFPSPPAIRKVSDDIFYQVKNAIEPPTVKVQLQMWERFDRKRGAPSGADPTVEKDGGGLKYDEVKVLNQEAMGMYQVAVLAAGSADALSKWMKKHKYIFPAGMESVVGEYVEKKWCFVAVKARVGKKDGVKPRPGMRDTDPDLPKEATFSGAVQAMGFRFKVDEPVIPMRLSAHNPGELHNIVYALMDHGVRFRQLPRRFVKKQISGVELYKNLTEPLPCTFTYWEKGKNASQTVKRGEEPDLPKDVAALYQSQKTQILKTRDPALHSGQARDVFASDIIAAKDSALILKYEERQKELLNIGEELGLRGPHVDDLMDKETRASRGKMLADGLSGIKTMTMTVIEGDFPREVIRDEDLTLIAYNMPHHRKKSLVPAPVVVLLVILVVTGIIVRSRLKAKHLLPVCALAIFAGGLAAEVQDTDSNIEELGDKKTRASAMEKIVKRGKDVVPDLLDAVNDNSFDLNVRGWAMVCVARINDPESYDSVKAILETAKQSALVRLWAAGTMGELAPKKALEDIIEGLGQGRYGWPEWDFSSGQRKTKTGTLYDSLSRHILQSLGLKKKDELIRVVLQGRNNVVRRQAAAFLGGEPIDGPETRARYMKAITFDNEMATSKGTPWKGGALFIPGVAYTPEEARMMISNLTHWMLWTEQNARGRDQQNWQITRNNLVAMANRNGLSGGWKWAAVDWTIAWFDKFGAAKDKDIRIEAGELLIHAMETANKKQEEIRTRLKTLVGKDLGKDSMEWRRWVEKLKKEDK